MWVSSRSEDLPNTIQVGICSSRLQENPKHEITSQMNPQALDMVYALLYPPHIVLTVDTVSAIYTSNPQYVETPWLNMKLATWLPPSDGS
ncbi:hypothetical protein HHI36_022380 [Cryptolaemus montrouzieri]|uniref:Uncharacterized protein n=1 Tax=Cryptolaemus montrouzieri TaxID=559131 RepID=A0ABD2N0D9_9CUCU